MATATEPLVAEEACDVPFPITSETYFRMVELGLIPEDRPVYLWDGRLYEKMAKTRPHVGIHNAFLNALMRRMPQGLYVGAENPVRLDERHTPLPDLVVLRGEPLTIVDMDRYHDYHEVVLVVEIAVSSLPKDLGERLSRYALTLPDAAYVVADVKNRRALIHRGPRPAQEAGRGEYAEVEEIGPGQMIRLEIGGVALDPIPFEEVMR
jgi:Uma2 family endonuclease